LLDTKHDDYEANVKKSRMFIWVFPQKNAAVTKPAGEWNESRIKQVNGKIEFYLNGVLTAEQDLTSKEWKDLVAKSNFKYFATFGKTVKGRIALQDWSKE
jgi:formylmethanofuran:tetrahydromethanopterin formyltransferase